MITVFIYLATIVFFAGFIQGITGFGSAMIAVSLLSLFLDIKTVIPLVALLSLITVSILTYQLKEHFKYSHIHPLLIGSVPGIAVGILFLKSISAFLITAILGVILFLYGTYNLLKGDGAIKIGKSTGYFLGFLAGYLGGAFNTNGPPAILYATAQPWSRHQIKVTLTSYFFISGLMVAASHAVSGLTTEKVISLFFRLAPFLAAGTLAGSKLYDKLHPDRFRNLMFIFLTVMGVGLIIKAVFYR